MNFFKKLGASIKEFFRKKVVSLKRNPKLVPLVILLFGFVYYSLNITAIFTISQEITRGIRFALFPGVIYRRDFHGLLIAQPCGKHLQGFSQLLRCL